MGSRYLPGKNESSDAGIDIDVQARDLIAEDLDFLWEINAPVDGTAGDVDQVVADGKHHFIGAVGVYGGAGNLPATVEG
jgi:hypothetical protein